MTTDGSRGLSAQEAVTRLSQVGPNLLFTPAPVRFWATAAEELREPMILLLILIGVLYAFWGELRDAITIFVVIVFLVMAEVINEFRAKRAIAALEQLSEPKSPVRRDDKVITIDTECVVPGDELILVPGASVVADAKLTSAVDLSFDESSLTGESMPVQKSAGDSIYAGTVVLGGEGEAEATATGLKTRLGQMSAQLVDVAPPKTPMQQAMAALSGKLVWVALAAAIIIPLIGILRGGGSTGVSLADLIVLGGCAAIEQAATAAGVPVTVPFTPGRRDTTQDLTDVEMFTWLKPVVDGFRNYVDDSFEQISPDVSPEEMFLDKAQLLSLTAPEWVALAGGLRVMGANHDRSSSGTFTDRVGVLSNDFFTVLTSMAYEWKKVDEKGMTFTLDDRESGIARFEATRCDLIFGANSQLRAVAEVYAASDGQARFVRDFVKVWDKVMMLDRYDVRG